MADFTSVTFGVEWNAADVVPGTICGFNSVPQNAIEARAFMTAMQDHGHERKFAWGDGDAWASDFEHPEVTPSDKKGDSLNWADNVHMVYFAGHGAQEEAMSFASNHFSCRAYYNNMRLGVKNLRWLLLSICGAVIGDSEDSIWDSVMKVWQTPTSGDSAHPIKSLHIVGTFIGEQWAGIHSDFGADFAVNVSAFGHPIGNAWLDAGFSRSGDETNRPIAIAFGRDEAEVIAVRDQETLTARDQGPVEANYLAFKWRSG